MDEKLIIYTTNGCDVCDRARAELVAEGTEFEERKRGARQGVVRRSPEAPRSSSRWWFAAAK